MKTVLIGMLAAVAISTSAMAAGDVLSYRIINLQSGGGPSGSFKLASADACTTAIKSMNDFWVPLGYAVVAECK